MTKTARSLSNYHSGLAAEAIVVHDYEKRGTRLAAQRWRGKGGEIDLVFRDGNCVIFTEVKKSKTHDMAIQRLTRRQMDRLCTAADEFLGGEPRGLLTDMRFDVATVDQTGSVRIIENAFALA